MGNKPSAIELIPGPGFQKIKANQVPGYEKYDFGNYEIWGPYKKTLVPGPFGSIVWKDSPSARIVDDAYVYDMCSLSEQKIRDGVGLKTMTSFDIVPNLGTDKPACLADNLTMFGKQDDGLFYIHYKHPVFARIMRSGPTSSGFSGLIPTLFAAKQIEKGEIPTLKRAAPTSLQNVAEIGYLAYKAKDLKDPKGDLPQAIREPLDQAVELINRETALLNFGVKRVLGGKRKTKTRKHRRRSH
jgi:hypothetical protein